MTSVFTIRDATSADAEAIRALLHTASLPLDGVEHVRFAVAVADDTVIGCAGLEVHGDAALLRSVAVHDAWRGQHVGDALVRTILDQASTCGLDPVVLLTTTAPAWFPRFGFTPVTRDAVPSELLASAEFTGACPASAIIMCRQAKVTT